MRRGYQTQWAGQFGVAHELVRRGYLVTFTTGNAPDDDLLCLSPSGVAFSVQVKSLSSKSTSFSIRRACWMPKPTRFLVFVFVPLDCSKPPEYFVLNNEQLRRLEAESKADFAGTGEGAWQNLSQTIFTGHTTIPPSLGHDFRNAWGNLPE